MCSLVGTLCVSSPSAILPSSIYPYLDYHHQRSSIPTSISFTLKSHIFIKLLIRAHKNERRHTRSASESEPQPNSFIEMFRPRVARAPKTCRRKGTIDDLPLLPRAKSSIPINLDVTRNSFRPIVVASSEVQLAHRSPHSRRVSTSMRSSHT